jgi:hypothetical protein
MFEKILFDVNVSRWPCEEEPIRKVVCTPVVQFVWDRQVLPNLCVLAIYLKLIPIFGNKVRRFDESQCENDDGCLFSQTWVPSHGHYHWLKGPLNPLPIKHKANYLVHTVHQLIEFPLL